LEVGGRYVPPYISTTAFVHASPINQLRYLRLYFLIVFLDTESVYTVRITHASSQITMVTGRLRSRQAAVANRAMRSLHLLTSNSMHLGFNTTKSLTAVSHIPVGHILNS